MSHMKSLELVSRGGRRSRVVRVRACLLAAVCVTLTLYVVVTSRVGRHSLDQLVQHTHKQLSNINIQESIREPEVFLRVDETYLARLGFNETNTTPRLYPYNVWTNTTLPVVVTAVWSGGWQHVVRLLSSVRAHRQLQETQCVVYAVDVDETEMQLLAGSCNTSSSCLLRRFRHELYPSHLTVRHMRAVVPVIIQEVLDQAGAVLWLDSSYRLLVTANISQLIGRARRVGVVAWPSLLVDDWTAAVPTTAYTHPRMFRYFNASLETFYFHRMVSDRLLILFNTGAVHRTLMMPWLQCVLLWECVAPLGAQPHGCRFAKRPRYRYSGCHGYSSSALNLALGCMFGVDDDAYMSSLQSQRVYTELDQDSEDHSAIYDVIPPT